MATSRHAWVDVAKAMSIILVVAHHGRGAMATIGVDDPAVDATVRFFTELRMPLFFTASGLFAASWVRRSWGELVQGKLALLIWVFLLWQPVVIAYQAANMLWMAQPPRTPDEGLLWTLITAPLKPRGEVWFLWALVWYFVLARATARWPRGLVLGAAAAVSVAWALIYPNLPLGVPTMLGVWSGLPKFIVFFAAGLVLSPRILTFFGGLRPLPALALTLPWVAAVLLQRNHGGGEATAHLLIGVLGVVAGFAIATRLASVAGLARLGQLTLPVYVAHTAMLTALGVLIANTPLLGPAQANPAITMLLVVPTAILLSLQLHTWATSRPVARYAYLPPPWFLGAGRYGRATRTPASSSGATQQLTAAPARPESDPR
ncbi:acyltransferase [Janibacter alkaliphilus]|uniref:Putative membrane protein YcfT n=1 Tax=Janibacter alkaliphilus TaxID=1069963 RepID=A0A852XDF3_9MICO|nr:acyltransferase [Janibacter alkaliphilus]NYG36505.1 putative membrane protein YcfT [Janibacter alkaliphilus]